MTLDIEDLFNSTKCLLQAIESMEDTSFNGQCEFIKTKGRDGDYMISLIVYIKDLEVNTINDVRRNYNFIRYNGEVAAVLSTLSFSKLKTLNTALKRNINPVIDSIIEKYPEMFI